jgi:hypothetical protein
MRFTHNYHADNITQLQELSEKGLEGCHIVLLRAFESAHVAVIYNGELYDLSSAPLTSEVLTTIKVS